MTKIKAEIAEKQKKPEQSISLLPGKIAGLAGGAPSKAVFIEINKDGLIIFPDQPLWKEKQPAVIKTAEIAKDAALGKLMAAVLAEHRVTARPGQRMEMAAVPIPKPKGGLVLTLA